MVRRVYLVLPKEDSYMFKDDNTKHQVTRVLNEWLATLGNTNLQLCCFAEDTLARKLLANKTEVIWRTVVDESDLRFMDKSLHLVDNDYRLLPKKAVAEEYIKQAVEKFKPQNPRGLNQEEYKKMRHSILRSRIRYVCNKVLSIAPVVVYLNANNGYCNEPEAEVGNGQLLCIVDYVTGVGTYYIGGIQVNRGVFLKALEDMYGKNL